MFSFYIFYAFFCQQLPLNHMKSIAGKQLEVPHKIIDPSWVYLLSLDINVLN